MRRTLPIPMWRDGALTQLSTVLRAVDDNDWAWQLRDFAGVGAAPGGKTMQEFETEVRRTPVAMSWNELGRFAEAIEQVQDCLIVGMDPAAPTARASQVEDDTAGARLVIEAVDSTMWEFTSPDTFLLERIAKRLGAKGSGSRRDSDL